LSQSRREITAEPRGNLTRLGRSCNIHS